MADVRAQARHYAQLFGQLRVTLEESYFPRETCNNVTINWEPLMRCFQPVFLWYNAFVARKDRGKFISRPEIRGRFEARARDKE